MQRTAFSSLAYAQHAARSYGLRTRMHLVSRAGTDEAGVIVHWRQRGIFRNVVVPPFTQYSALLVRRRPSEAVVHRRETPLEALLQDLERIYRPVRLLSALADPRPAQWRRWRASPLFTYCLDPGAGIGTWSEATRRAFRKHQESYKIRESAAAAEDIVGLCAGSYKRHGRKLPTRPALLLRMMSSLGDRIRCFVASRRDAVSPEAGMAVLHDGRTAHYWVAGSVPGPSMTVLIGHVLPLLQASGIRTFDFVGANTPSIAEFKRHFGPTLTPYYALELHT